jgi:hypothetical protein
MWRSGKRFREGLRAQPRGRRGGPGGAIDLIAAIF